MTYLSCIVMALWRKKISNIEVYVCLFDICLFRLIYSLKGKGTKIIKKKPDKIKKAFD